MLLVSDQFNLILSVFPELPQTRGYCATTSIASTAPDSSIDSQMTCGTIFNNTSRSSRKSRSWSEFSLEYDSGLGDSEASYPQRRQATFAKTEQILDATKRKKHGSAQEAKDRRRERNKELARKTRLRKKEELDQLRELVECLQKENQRLVVDIIRSEIPDLLLLRMAGDRF